MSLYIANIQRYMDSELRNCVDILTIFKGFRYLTMYKQLEIGHPVDSRCE